MYQLTKERGSKFYRKRINNKGMKELYTEARIRETSDYPKDVEKLWKNINKDIDETLEFKKVKSIKDHRDDFYRHYEELCSMMENFRASVEEDEYLKAEAKEQIIENLLSIDYDKWLVVLYKTALINERIEKLEKEAKERAKEKYRQRNSEYYEELKRDPERYRRFINKTYKNYNGEGNQYKNSKAKKECVKNAGKCARCGADESLVGHHKIPVGVEGSTDTQENLVCLCHSCHQKLHYKLRQKEYTPKEILDITEEFITSVNP